MIKYLMTILFATALMSGGGFSSLAIAEDGGQHKEGCEYPKDEYHQDGHHKGGQHDGKQCEHHGGAQWKASLTDEQQKKVDAIHVDYKKQKHALREKIKDAKLALAKETIKDAPDTSVIYVKINDVVKLKATKMRLKAAHHINVRKLLTKEQRVKFDEHVINEASHGKRHTGNHN